MLFLPHGTPEQLGWYDELLGMTTTPGEAVRLFRARGMVDVVDAAYTVKVRTVGDALCWSMAVPAGFGSLAREIDDTDIYSRLSVPVCSPTVGKT